MRTVWEKELDADVNEVQGHSGMLCSIDERLDVKLSQKKKTEETHSDQHHQRAGTEERASAKVSYFVETRTSSRIHRLKHIA